MSDDLAPREHLYPSWKMILSRQGSLSSHTPTAPPPAFAWDDMVRMPILLIALYIGMVAVAAWAWVVVPGEQRFSVRVGAPPSFDGTLGKRTALLMWLAQGAVVLAGSLMAATDDEANLGMLAVAGAGLLIFLLLMEIVSVRRLMR